MKTALCITFLAAFISFVGATPTEPVITMPTNNVTNNATNSTTASMTTVGVTTLDTTTDMTTLNTTTANETMTTLMITTTPQITTIVPPTLKPGAGEWIKRDDDGNACMKMTFQGNITWKGGYVLIPSNAESNSSKCIDDGGNTSNFTLSFDSGDTMYSVCLCFILQDQLNMYLWNANISSRGGSAEMSDSQVQVLFQTPVGKSFQCDKQVVPVGSTFNLTLTQMRIQPFATFAKNDYGGAYSCVQSSGPNAALITGLVLGAVIFILLLAVIHLYRKKRAPGGGYGNFTGNEAE